MRKTIHLKDSNTKKCLRLFIFLTIILFGTNIMPQSSDIISTGQYHSLSIHTDGTLWGWGSNEEGQLGLGSIISSDNPSQVGTENNWSLVSTGANYTLIIKTDGTLWAMGSNDFGELGDGTNSSKDTPIQIGSDNNWKSVSCGEHHTIATKTDGTLWTWGRNNWGQLGLGNTTNINSPDQLGNDTDWVSITTSSESSFAIKTDGTLWSWGRNSFDNGVLGYSSGSDVVNNPQQVGNENDWKHIEAGFTHALAIKTNGTLWAWGRNSFGQIGNSTYTYQKLPIQIGTDTDWNKVRCGYMHSFAIKNDGTLWDWGNNAYGQSNPDNTDNSNTPQLFNSDTNWLTVSGGETHSISKKTDNTLRTWGNNYNSQLGGGTYIWNIPTPTLINPSNQFEHISAGGNQSSAVTTNGKAWYWGFNNFSLYFFTDIYHSSNIPTTITQDNNWKTTSAGVGFTIAIKDDGTLWGWGNNNDGQIGNGQGGTISSIETTPSQIGNDTDWQKTSSGSPTMAIKTNGTLWAWGGGHLGDGTTDGSLVPIQIGNDTNWTHISRGNEHTLAIKSDGTLWAWGVNNNGTLGNGQMFGELLTPTKIGTDSDWNSVSAGKVHSLAIKNDGTLWSWGLNSRGQLGYSGTRSTTPKQVGVDTDWQKIDAGKGLFSLGIKNESTLWSWGENTFGQLGDGTFANRTVPMQIGTDNNWQNVSAGTTHVVGIKINNEVWSWGNNFRGQLGIRNSVIAIDFATLTTDGFLANNQSIKLYPNPTTDFVEISTNSSIDIINIFSLLGKNITVDVDDNRINMTKVPKGIYILLVKTKDNKEYHFKVIKE
ncbi:MAG: T9SS type A sorting domain-containing protein [Flavobacteriaceae bacterium]